MATGGRIVFGVNNAAKATVASTTTYNNNAWHHAMATAGTTGLRLYIDGTQVATSTTVASGTYGGFFRVGYDSLTNWTPTASSGQFLGSIDEAAVYSATLTATDAADHYRSAT